LNVAVLRTQIPWDGPSKGRRELSRSTRDSRLDMKSAATRTPVVLPLPGLGDVAFLSSLLSIRTADVFGSGPMALVLRVLWHDHIRSIFYLDCFPYVVYYSC
jgi:hypothetical protein